MALDHRLVEGLMQAIAPVIKTSFADTVEKATAPLLQRIAELEARPVEKGEPGPPGKDAESVDVSFLLDHLAAKIPSPLSGKDGKDADPEAVAALVAETVAEEIAKLPVPQNGKDADPVEVALLVAPEVAKLIPTPENGKDADPELVKTLVAETVAEEIAKLPVPQNGKDGEPGRSGEMGLVPDDLAEDVSRVIRLMAEFPAQREIEKSVAPIADKKRTKKVFERDANNQIVASYDVEVEDEEVEA